ncbi:MAG: ATP-binding protein, partial [Gillisia sp.]|nr:ATP-binding protein [Gillisia sp.]
MKKNYFFLLIFLMAFAKFYSQQSAYKDLHLDSLYQITTGHFKKYEFKESIEVAMQLRQESRNRGNDYYDYHSNNILGNNYAVIRDTLYSRERYKDALNIALKLDSDTLLLNSYNKLGNTYSEDEKTTQIGIDYYNKAIRLATKMNYESKLLAPTANLAWTYIDNGLYDKALPYLKNSWELLGNRDDNLIKAQLLTLMGRYNVGINELEEAKSHFEEAIQRAEKDTLILEASLVYKEYANLLFKQGSYKEAFLALEKYDQFNSKIFEKEKLRQIEAANVKFDVIQYQKDLEISKNEQLYKDELIEKSQLKTFIAIISSIVLIIIILGLYKNSRYRRKLNKDLLEKNKELVIAKEEAERLSILKTKFFSTISHELRTPLYGVIGLTSILMEDKTLTSHENDLKSLKFSADYLLALINDVLQMNKMESNLLKLENLSFNLKDLMHSIVKSFEFTRLQNKNVIHLEIDPKIPLNLIGDPIRLSQILMNVVGNATKFTERGNIWISTKLVEDKTDSAKIYFEIKDDGLGIPKNKHQIIFEEFSQLKSENYNYQGTGLGLPIVKKLLLLFNSEIHLESQEEQGSVFSFEIDFKKAATGIVDNGIETIKDEPTLQETEGRRILIVDDNRINQVVTQRILEQKSFICEISDNGLDAIEKVRNNYFDLVLMDVNMPGITGIEATVKIREFNKDIPVVALT